MTLRSRLLLTTAALSLALSAGGFAAAQNRTNEPMQNGTAQNSTQKQNQNQVPNKSQAQGPSSNDAGAANNKEAQNPPSQGSTNNGSNNNGSNNNANSSQAQAPSNNAPMNNNARANNNNNGQMQNNARSNQNTGNKGAQAPASGSAAQNKPPAGTNQNAERGTGRNENENAADRGGERNDNAATQTPNRSGNAEQREGSSRTSTRLSSAEKTKLEGAIGKLNVRSVSNVNVSVAVGTVVPRSVALHPLPASIVAIVPQFRGFDFFVVRDEFVIVEPRTHKIVEVIERSGGARTAETTRTERTRKLSLSERDRTYIRKHYAARRTIIDRAGPRRETHIVVGEDVPESVTIERFPREVYHRVPSIRSYGYIHEGRDLYLVEPGSRRVIESIGPDED